jgi:hypothetical protein
MNKGNKAAPIKTVSVAASAPLLPQGEQYTPCEAKRRHLAGMTPYHPSAYVSIRAGSNSDDEDAEGQGKMSTLWLMQRGTSSLLRMRRPERVQEDLATCMFKLEDTVVW